MPRINKAVFLGSKKFGLEVFKALYASTHDLEWKIYCPADSEDPRSHQTSFMTFAKDEELELICDVSPKLLNEMIETHQPDIMFVCGYYRILPDQLLSSIPEGVWGIHNSLLPRYRGGSPLVWQLINNECELGSSLFKFSKGMDDGDILHQVRISNHQRLTIKDAMDQLEELWVKELPQIWLQYLRGDISPFSQDHAAATYCAQRQESDGLINWSASASQIDCFIRAQAAPYPKAFFILGDKTIKISRHEIDTRVISGTIGQVFEVKKDYVTICCGHNSAIRLYEIEVGGEIAQAPSFLNSIKLRLLQN